ncbi:MAG: phage portal protein, partial [Pseudomonadota bacterium]
MPEWWSRLRADRSAADDARVEPTATTATEAKAAGGFGGPVQLAALKELGQGAWGPRGYHAFARDGMMRNAVVYRCVRLISEAAASVPLRTYVDNRHVADHPLADLIRAPEPATSGTDFFEAWYGYLLVSGNVFAQAVAAGGQVRALNLIRPDRMRVRTDAGGWADGFTCETARGPKVLDGDAVDGVREILHVRLFHPSDDHYGLSPIEAAATAIDIHNGASRWNKALLDNAARPSGALVYSTGGHMTDTQFDRLKSELEENFQGARNAGRPLLLEGGLDWKAMSLSPRDMDFIAAKNAAAREIALALGVPPMLLGIPGDNTYSNYQEAHRNFWRQTVLPLVQRTAHALEGWLNPAFAQQVSLRLDLDAIEAFRS